MKQSHPPLKNNLPAGAMKPNVSRTFQKFWIHFLRFHLSLSFLTFPCRFLTAFTGAGKIRNLSKVPILFLSSAADNMNIVMAMNLGADDFVAKPFDFSVLTAKIQAILRRTYDFSTESNLIACGDAILNLRDASFSYQGTRLELTKNDFRILQTLMEHSGKTISRDELMTALWENDSYIDENTLTVNIARLRRKLEDIGLENFIITKKGMGYLIQS